MYAKVSFSFPQGSFILQKNCTFLYKEFQVFPSFWSKLEERLHLSIFFNRPEISSFFYKKASVLNLYKVFLKRFVFSNTCLVFPCLGLNHQWNKSYTIFFDHVFEYDV